MHFSSTVSLFAVCLSVLVYICFIFPNEPCISSDTSINIPSIEGNSLESSDVSKQLIQDISARGTPVILKDSIPSSWPARKWTPSLLSTYLPRSSVYRQSNNGTFITFHDDQPLEPYQTRKWIEFNSKIQVPTKSLFEKESGSDSESSSSLNPPIPTPWYYFSSNFNNLVPPQQSSWTDWWGQIAPFKHLFVMEDQRQVALITLSPLASLPI